MKQAFDLERVESLTKLVLEGGEPLHALQELELQNGLLKQQFESEPQSGPASGLMEVAFRLTKFARQIALELGRRGEVRFEEMAWALRCKPVLATLSHRHDLVGPAMLDWADCNRRLGNLEKADFLYEAVIKDFLEVLEWPPELGRRRDSALDSLLHALNHSRRDYGQLLDKAEKARGRGSSSLEPGR